LTFSPKKKQIFELRKQTHILQFVRVSNQLLQKYCRGGKFAAQKFLGKFEEIRAKYLLHTKKFAYSFP